MDCCYIGAYERIQLGITDRRILSYEENTSLRQRLRGKFSGLFRQCATEAVSEVSRAEKRRNRMNELKGIIQHSHPDKPTADLKAFRAAKQELDHLRRNMAG